jgi:hypothetical protein
MHSLAMLGPDSMTVRCSSTILYAGHGLIIKCRNGLLVHDTEGLFNV